MLTFYNCFVNSFLGVSLIILRPKGIKLIEIHKTKLGVTQIQARFCTLKNGKILNNVKL